MSYTKGITFFCHRCNIKFSDKGEEGVAICPLCKRGHESGFNLINEKGDLQCPKCRCTFNPNVLKSQVPACPNKC